jgi:hypothetical protein
MLPGEVPYNYSKVFQKTSKPLHSLSVPRPMRAQTVQPTSIMADIAALVASSA